jgi:hypothetical protein
LLSVIISAVSEPRTKRQPGGKSRSEHALTQTKPCVKPMSKGYQPKGSNPFQVAEFARFPPAKTSQCQKGSKCSVSRVRPSKTEVRGQRSEVSFGGRKAVNDKKVPDRVGSGVISSSLGELVRGLTLSIGAHMRRVTRPKSTKIHPAHPPRLRGNRSRRSEWNKRPAPF